VLAEECDEVDEVDDVADEIYFSKNVRRSP